MATRAKRQRSWSYSTGERGANRVRVYERSDLGIWIDFRDEHGKRCRHPLGTDDRAAAKGKADEIAAKFRREAKRQPAEVTLAGLIDNYVREVTPTKSAIVQAHDRRAFELFVRFFGPGRKPVTLSRRDWDAFIAARRSGKLRPPNADARRVRDRIVEQDLRLLNALLNWAVQSGDGNGNYLLERNPFKGLPVPKEESPARALLSATQYERLRTAAVHLHSWLECFLVLAWHTGHRANSLRQLRWSDVDLDAGRIHFRGEVDKIGLDHWNPLHGEAVAILRRERSRVSAIGDAWIFPASRDSSQCLSRDAMANWWKRLAVAAELPTGERYGWHSCRRAFANRLRAAPLRDLQDLGGWKTAATLLTVYLRPDEDAQRQALQGIAPLLSAPASEASTR